MDPEDRRITKINLIHSLIRSFRVFIGEIGSSHDTEVEIFWKSQITPQN